MTARDPTAGLITDQEAALPSTAVCFTDDFEACIAPLRLPVTRRSATRSTNLLERLSGLKQGTSRAHLRREDPPTPELHPRGQCGHHG